ncbi:hypothetical protein BDW59DRAFT_157512 [Aspergillus cavernicola]|uniref:Xylanolytic transcriptional activator regulatory domain-containing protein n=1 Tax=Aspergillus cavernicola TaxID=176166 RepID=A0ABR4IW88_9EURO
MQEPTGSEQYDTESPLPTRALRKGTRSCKRRKTRCFYDRPMDATCVACYRRGKLCYGQEFMDVPVPDLGGEQTIVERLKRAEHILGTISKDISPDARGSRSSASGSQSGSGLSREIVDQGRLGREISDSEGDSAPVADTPDTNYVAEVRTDGRDHPYPKYFNTCSTLHASLPSQADIDVLFGTSRAIVFVQAICNHYGELFHEGDFRPVSAMTTLPAVTAHPVVLARKLLQLALCIQQIDPSFDRSALGIGHCLNESMDTYFNLASGMVTCHEELLDSIEGLECLVYEGVFLVNSGNLRRALVCLRRASTMAQFMGLHRKVPYKQKQHDRETHVSGAVIWAHITYLERYMSLLLGMPTATSRVRFSTEEIPAGDSSADWFEKMQIDIFERMIERNQEHNYGDLAATQKIDDDMNKMANKVPAMWWAPVDLTQNMDHKVLMEKVISAQLQIVHYNLLTVLHLPYLLWNTDDNRFDYSKTTCIYASREVLNRFITFRSIVKIVTCCRPVDFCAFTASLTLLLTYLNSHKQNSGLMLNHQRLGDRALIETAMETMDELNKLNNDELSKKTAELTRKLLKLEAECARGGQTYHSSVEEQQDEPVGGEEHCFHLKIPYFGTVKLSCDVPPDSQLPDTVSTPAFPSFNQYATWSQNNTMADYGYTQMEFSIPAIDHSSFALDPVNIFQDQIDLEMPDLMATADNWAFQGVDSAFFDALMSGNPASQGTEDEAWGGYTLSI